MSKIPRLMNRFGWVVFTLMWIPFIFIFFTVPDGSYSFDELLALGWKSLLPLALTLGMAALAMLLLFGSPAVSWFFKLIARARGERMTALIVDIRSTGLRVNRTYDEMRLDLEINYMGETTRVSTEKLFSNSEKQTYKTGMTVDVMYDPLTKLVALLD